MARLAVGKAWGLTQAQIDALPVDEFLHCVAFLQMEARARSSGA